MQKLQVKQDGKLVECGCTFTYAGGFVYKCEIHKAMREALRQRRERINRMRFNLLGPIKPKKAHPTEKGISPS